MLNDEPVLVLEVLKGVKPKVPTYISMARGTQISVGRDGDISYHGCTVLHAPPEDESVLTWLVPAVCIVMSFVIGIIIGHIFK